jgi:hypothetical protein
MKKRIFLLMLTLALSLPLQEEAEETLPLVHCQKARCL